jgi:uncharacterized membrane protein YbaN (DUF454 family)
MAKNIYVAFGLLFVALGIFSLLHPQFSYRVSRHEDMTRGVRTLVETRRVMRVPRAAAAAFVLLGLAIGVTGVKGI